MWSLVKLVRQVVKLAVKLVVELVKLVLLVLWSRCFSVFPASAALEQAHLGLVQIGSQNNRESSGNVL